MVDVMVIREALLRVTEVISTLDTPRNTMDKLNIDGTATAGAMNAFDKILSGLVPEDEKYFYLGYLMFILGVIAGRIEVDSE